MAVVNLRWLAAVSASLPAVAVAAVGLGAEQADPAGPMRTPAPILKDAEVRLNQLPRIVTAAPAPRELFRRDGKTCGFVDGHSRSAYTCVHSEAQCLFNSDASAVGCCLTTDCLIYTACVPYTSSGATRTMDIERTRYCSDPDYPHCAAFLYHDATNSLSGFTIPTCDSASTTYTMYFSPTRNTRPASRSSSDDLLSRTTVQPSETSAESTQPTPRPESTGSSPSSGASRGGDGDDDDDPETTSGSSAPVGAIVGGVVGGVAALALIALAIFFLIRRKDKNQPLTPPAPPAADPSGPTYVAPGGPAGQGFANQPQPPNMSAVPPGGYYDPRASMAKPPVTASASPVPHSHTGGPGSAHMSVSPSSSPPPIYPGGGPGQMPAHHHPGAMGVGMGMAPTPPPPQGPHNNGQYVPYPGPQMHQHQHQHQHQPHPHGVAELPTQRGDGQLHELH